MSRQKHHKIIQNIRTNYKNEYVNVPIKADLYAWVNHLIQTLFPISLPTNTEIEKELAYSEAQFLSMLRQTQIKSPTIEELSAMFYEHLPALHLDLIKDAEEVWQIDPASKCLGEVLHVYPGFYAICIHRIAHIIHTTLQLPYIPRMLSEYAHGKTGIDIHPAAQIGVPFLIDHGTGVVIGETCKIGKHVHLYQGVTLGALQVEKNMQNQKRHPTIEDHVVIYANATILGGSTIVGNHSVIGGNVFLTKTVDPFSLVFTRPDMIIKKIKSKTEAINFVI